MHMRGSLKSVKGIWILYKSIIQLYQHNCEQQGSILVCVLKPKLYAAKYLYEWPRLYTTSSV